MTKKLWMSVVALVFTVPMLLASRADAAQPAAAPAGAQRHARIDQNGDHMVSRAEAANRPRLARHFDRIDRNHDGQLDRKEMRAAKRRHAKHAHARRHRG